VLEAQREMTLKLVPTRGIIPWVFHRLGRVTWHQFRHIHSSLLNDLRVPVKIAQEQLGHASIQRTLNIYTHVVDASHRAAIEQLEQRLFPTVPKSPKADTPSESLSTRKRAGQDWPANRSSNSRNAHLRSRRE